MIDATDGPPDDERTEPSVVTRQIEDQPVRRPRPEMTMKAWAGDPIDQRDLRAIAKALELTDEPQAYDIVRGYSPGELTREIQILIESLFE